MKTKLINMGLVIGLSTSLFGFTYEIKDGWQQLGATQDINDLSAFNNQCIDYLWYYDISGDKPEWKLHIANGSSHDYCGKTLPTLKKGQGFWAKASGECSITVGTDSNNDCNSNMPAPPDLENPQCITCDTNMTNSSTTNNTDNTTVFNSNFFTLDNSYHGASITHERYIFLYPKVKFTDKPKTIKMKLGDNLEIVYYNAIKSTEWGDDYGIFEYMTINGVSSNKNMTIPETKEFVTNNISIDKYPYSWTSNGGYLTFTNEEQAKQIKYYLEKK